MPNDPTIATVPVPPEWVQLAPGLYRTDDGDVLLELDGDRLRIAPADADGQLDLTADAVCVRVAVRARFALSSDRVVASIRKAAAELT